MRTTSVWSIAAACLGLGVAWCAVSAMYASSDAGTPTATVVHQSAASNVERGASAATPPTRAERRARFADEARRASAPIHYEGEGESPVAVRVMNLSPMDGSRYSAFLVVTNVSDALLPRLALRPLHEGEPLLPDNRSIRMQSLTTGVGQAVVCRFESAAEALDPAEIEFEVRLATPGAAE